jgi:hypothetical protein
MCISLCYVLDTTSVSNHHTTTAVKLRFLTVNLRHVDFAVKFMENAGHFRVKNPMSNDVTSISKWGVETVKFYQFLLGSFTGFGSKISDYTTHPAGL